MPKYTSVTRTSNFRVALNKFQINAVMKLETLYGISTKLEAASNRVGMVTIRILFTCKSAEICSNSLSKAYGMTHLHYLRMATIPEQASS
jgi:hypothetical protein